MVINDWDYEILYECGPQLTLHSPKIVRYNIHKHISEVIYTLSKYDRFLLWCKLTNLEKLLNKKRLL